MTFENLITAYVDCRRHKRNGHEALAFEIDLERNLMELWNELRNGTYSPGHSRCFIVDKPVRREIFAGAFRDRIVQHLVFNRIEPILERTMIHDSYSCRKGRGTLFGIRRLRRFIAQCSEGYTRDCYLLKCDLKGFFMSIDRMALADRLQQILEQEYTDSDKAEVIALTRCIALHDPLPGARICSPPDRWRLLPPDKSLFGVSGRPMPGQKQPHHSTRKEHCGLPIGNITSQLFANFYLTPFDHFVKHTLGVRYYGRYADNFVIVHHDKTYLRRLVPLLERYLRDRLGLTLHPRKRYLQHASKGILFLGAFIRRDALFVGPRTKNGLIESIHRWNAKAQNRPLEQKEWIQLRDTVNSYWGLMRHHNSFRLRVRSAQRLAPWVAVGLERHGVRKVALPAPDRKTRRRSARSTPSHTPHRHKTTPSEKPIHTANT